MKYFPCDILKLPLLYLKDSLIWKGLGLGSPPCAKSMFFYCEMNGTISCHKNAHSILCILRDAMALRMSWSTADVSLCSELAHGSWGLFLPLSVKTAKTSGEGLEPRLSSHTGLNKKPTPKPLEYDSGAGPLAETNGNNNIKFDENKSGTHTSSSYQRFSGSYILACGENLPLLRQYWMTWFWRKWFWNTKTLTSCCSL